MTAGEVVALARRACARAEMELRAARRSGNATRLRAAALHWQYVRRDLQRAEAVCR